MSAEKVEQYGQLLNDNYIVQTFVDVDQCKRFPDYLKGHVKLDIGLNLPVPIPLFVDIDGIRADLSFSRVVYDVFIPWHAVLGVYAESMGAVASAADHRAEETILEDNVVKVDFRKRRKV